MCTVLSPGDVRNTYDLGRLSTRSRVLLYRGLVGLESNMVDGLGLGGDIRNRSLPRDRDGRLYI